MSTSNDEWDRTLEDALASGESIGRKPGQLNEACEHIVQLLRDASTLLEHGSHATSAFLSITALEETAKVHIGFYRRSATPIKRSKDPLFRHDRKHELALGPTVPMGGRLKAALGEKRMLELVELGRNGSMVKIREASLYVEQQGEVLTVPKKAIQPTTSRELLLLAIESFDDALVGYTARTFELGQETDALFDKWSAQQ